MLEIPEAQTVARQMREVFTGKKVVSAEAGHTPHGFAWYASDLTVYRALLEGKTITGAVAYGGRPELHAEDTVLSFGDGVNLRYLAPGAPRPDKHQFLMELDDGSALFSTVQMYGGYWVFPAGTPQDFYYQAGRDAPSPLSDAFDAAYFASLLTDKTRKLSAKAFLATEQRIPGLGNGALQDISWKAGLHPKRKMNTLDDALTETLFHTVRALLADMTAAGGRDTEKDLFARPGGYRTVLSKNNNGMPCPACGTPIGRMAYLGGNVYVCEGCQPLEQ